MTELEKAANSICGVHPDWSGLECFRTGFKEGAKWQSKQSPWISVCDRFPYTDNGQSLYEVIVQMVDGRYNIAANIAVERLANKGMITKWMPIPE